MTFFLGKPEGHWRDVDAALARFNIKSAGQLMDVILARQRAAAAAPPPSPNGDLSVYDAGNTQRLLGTIRDGKRHFAGYSTTQSFKVAAHHHVAPPRHPAHFDYTAPTVDTAEFQLDWKQDGWDKIAVLTTRTALKVLLNVEGFRLPGERDHAAAERRYNQR